MIPEDGLYVPIVPLFPAGSTDVWKSRAMISTSKQCMP